MRINRFNTVTMVFTMVTACFVLISQGLPSVLSAEALAAVEALAKEGQVKAPPGACWLNR